MKITEAQVQEYLDCWMNNYGASGTPGEVVDRAFAYDAALVEWKFKADRWAEYPEFDRDYAKRVVAAYQSNCASTPTPRIKKPVAIKAEAKPAAPKKKKMGLAEALAHADSWAQGPVALPSPELACSVAQVLAAEVVRLREVTQRTK